MLKYTLKSLIELVKEYKKIVVAYSRIVSNKLYKKLNLYIKKYTRKLNTQLSLILIQCTRQDKFFNYTIVPLPLMNVIALVCQTLIQ
jgi:menaquinone-dependent protoporphyrinogen IX oxidase